MKIKRAQTKPAPTKPGRPGGVLIPVVFSAVSLGLLAWVGLESSGTFKRVRRLDPVTSAEVAVDLSRAGLGPEALAAAGLSPAQAAGVVASAKGYITTNAQVIRDQETAWGSDRAEVQRLERLASSGQADAQDLAALQDARTRLAASSAQRQASLDAIHAAGVADLTVAQQVTLATIRQNGDWEVPTQYLAVDRPEQEWVALRTAVAGERIAAQAGEPANPVLHQHLLTWDAQADVAAAAAGLTNNLSAITSTWNQGLTPP